MNQIKNAQNPEAELARMLQSNSNTSFISGLLRNGNNLETIARQMAQANGIDINQLIKALQ